jgi:proteasome assembly chaperone (PAC2) family protein
MSSSKAKRAAKPETGPLRAAGPNDGLPMADVLRFIWRPKLKGTPFIIGWTKDTGAVARLTADYLIEASNGSGFCQIEPTAFYSLGGVPVTDDVAQFPQSRFFHSPSNRIVVLRADEPQSNRYEFLNAVLDLADQDGRAQALYTVNGIAALNPHSIARRVSGIFNAPALQRKLQQWVPSDLSWQGPPHTSTYLLWLAGRRHLPGAGLWVEVPFYLADYEDYQSVKVVVSLLSMILGLEIDLTRLDRLATDQDARLAQLLDDPQTAQKIRALERGESLDRQDQLDLIEAAGNALK